jgi:hypothetical protein
MDIKYSKKSRIADFNIKNFLFSSVSRNISTVLTKGSLLFTCFNVWSIYFPSASNPEILCFKTHWLQLNCIRPTSNTVMDEEWNKISPVTFCHTCICLNTFCIVLCLLYYSTSGSRRPSVASIHSSASSSRSYSARRFERENMQRDQRQLQLQMQMQIQQDNLKPGAAPTPSPKTPLSTDELLPSVSEVREVREDDHCTCPSKTTRTNAL